MGKIQKVQSYNSCGERERETPKETGVAAAKAYRLSKILKGKRKEEHREGGAQTSSQHLEREYVAQCWKRVVKDNANTKSRFSDMLQAGGRSRK